MQYFALAMTEFGDQDYTCNCGLYVDRARYNPKAIHDTCSSLRRIVVHEGPDERGRYVYTVYHWAMYHPGDPAGEHRLNERGHVFRAALPDWPRLDAGPVRP